MKEQFKTIILPPLPIVGYLKILTTPSNIIFSVKFSLKSPATEETEFSDHCYNELKSYLSGQSQKINLPSVLFLKSDFKLKILDEINKIPYGGKRTYKDIGDSIQSKAFQAIGSACRNNPLILIYPCHRVVGKQNPLFYIGGDRMKKDLHNLEKSVRQN